MANAKIQFTVKLENIPLEVENRLVENMKRISDIHLDMNNLISLVESGNEIEAARLIKSHREEFNFIDMIHEDCYNILVAYADHKTKTLQPDKKEEAEKEE